MDLWNLGSPCDFTRFWRLDSPPPADEPHKDAKVKIQKPASEKSEPVAVRQNNKRKRPEEDGLSNEQRQKLVKTLVFKSGQPCPWPGCQKMIKGGLAAHASIHTKIKPFHCSVRGCSANFSIACYLEKHERKHSNLRPFFCGICNTRFKYSQSLKTHIRAHSDRRPFICDVCSARFNQKNVLDNHRRIHTGELPFKCDWVGCNMKFRQDSTLRQHQMAHSGEKPFKCSMCDYSSVQQHRIPEHFKANHTPEGAARQKKRENMLANELKKRGIVFEERGFGISFKCIQGTIAYPDFVVQREDAIQIIECDEDQHKGYPLSCDPIRASKIKEALVVSGETRPVDFYMFNPDSYNVNGITEKRLYRDKVDLLVKELEDKSVRGRRPLSLCYMFYDIHKGFPKVIWDPEYPKELKECVRCVY